MVSTEARAYNRGLGAVFVIISDNLMIKIIWHLFPYMVCYAVCIVVAYLFCMDRFLARHNNEQLRGSFMDFVVLWSAWQ